MATTHNGNPGRAAGKQNREARLEARITAAQKALIERAAAYEGRSVTDFLVSSVAAAQATIDQHEVIRLTPEQSAAFVESLLNPAPPNAKLRRAARAYRGSVKSR